MSGAERYPHVFRPFRIGSVSIRNRIFVPAHTTNYGADYLPSERHVAYHVEKAKGGIGLIIFEAVRVHPTGVGRVLGIAGYDRRCIQPFRRLVDAVHGHGVPMFAQLLHIGRHTEGYLSRTAVWAPSPVPWSPTGPVPHAMTSAEIDEIIAAHVVTAHYLREAGFDGLEVHLGHGHLLQEFLSPSSNKRTDEYGGDEDNRLRFPIAVVRAVRDAMGSDYPVGIRISAEEFLPDGLGLPEMQRIVPKIAAAVPLHFVNVSHSAYHASFSLATQFADMHFPLAPYRYLTAGIKSVVPDLPVFAVCRFNSLQLAEEVLAAGHADMVGMVRALIADPLLVAKTQAGREADIRPCIYCNQGCIGFIELDQPITCTMNPTTGREAEWGEGTLHPAKTRKRVLVVGGGPGGLEAARVAALRGHDVTLWERAGEVGGQVNIAARVRARSEFVQTRTYFERQCRSLGVKIACRVEATPDRVLTFSPDAVVLATGAIPRRPEFVGAERTLTVWDALETPERLGEHVVVIEADGHTPSVVVAEYLADLGKRVTVVTSRGTIGWRVNSYSMFATRHRFREKRIKIMPLRAVRAYETERLILEDLSVGDEDVIMDVTGVVAAYGGTVCDELYKPLKGQVPELQVIGDAVAPRTALDAIYEGHNVGRFL